MVWRRALELADPLEQHDRFAVALDLRRRSQAATIPPPWRTRLALGRSHLRARADDAGALAGERILDAAIALLGVKPKMGDAAGAGRP